MTTKSYAIYRTVSFLTTWVAWVSRSQYFPKVNISNMLNFRDKVGHRKPQAGNRMVPVSMTLSDPWPGFQGCSIFRNQIPPKQCKIAPQLLININRKSHAIYQMVSFPKILEWCLTWVSRSWYFSKAHVSKTVHFILSNWVQIFHILNSIYLTK